MNETQLDKRCGCCEGIEQLTPLATTNRPGLDALAYRVGTHSSFLETMIARLSSLTLELPVEGQSQEGQKIYPLQALTARQTSDPAIALLDSWATVADVLTFYQERIANEGYLRTAIERRSILELARLVGYRLRPGVAASVYLAFILDNGYQVTIPAGSRTQSIPGPGELPQSFETAEALPARAQWNALKPRLTRPQAITLLPAESATTIAPTTDASLIPSLYFDGITTNLKPGDPLLFVSGKELVPVLRRVERVEIQAAENRTQVILQSIPTGEQLGAVIASLRQALDHYLDLAAFGVDPTREMAGRVMDIIKSLIAQLNSTVSAEHLAMLLEEALETLESEHAIAVEGAYSRLQPWVGGLVEELTAMQAAIPLSRPVAAATAPMDVKPGSNNGNVSALSRLEGYLAAAAKPPSLQPANRLQLPRDIATTYATKSDVAPRLLAALRPELAPVLYRAWQALPLTPEVAVELLALRTRAAVFGHNAPATESFTIRVRFEDAESELQRARIRLTIMIGDNSIVYPENDQPPLELEPGEFEIDFPAANETITFTISISEPLPLELRFHFAHRPIVVVGRVDAEGRFHVTSSGSNPVTLAYDSGARDSSDDTGDNSPAVSIRGEINTLANASMETADIVWLDTIYAQIVPGSWVALERPYPSETDENGNGNNIPKTVIAQVTEVSEQSRADYGLPGLKSTRLTLDRNWLDPNNDSFAVIRGTAVYAQSEPLTLTETPIDPVVEAICDNAIELDGLYDGLEAGRWLIITGERTDVTPSAVETPGTTPAGEETTQFIGNEPIKEAEATGISGIPATELVMLAGVEQVYDATLPGETTHTRLLLATDLAYCYKRDTVTIYGNVAKATHGETRHEVLGSGDGSQAFQRFTLKQPPLTFVSAPTPSGVESSLVVRVNDVKWHEADNLAGLKPADRVFTTQTNDEEQTMVIFGDGRYGARLPTGIENVKAVYRNGIGKMGNVAAGQISLLVTRPLGVSGVSNPLPATGGADRDSRDQARRNAPIAITALDRLVSVQDYADFARTFAGIGKASAVRLTDGRRQVVHLTIAGAGDIPIDKNSDLYRNLGQALQRFGDPYQPVQIDLYQRKLLILSGKVRLLPDYLWEAVAPKIRQTLLDTFSFDSRRLGQDILLSEVISAIHTVRGIAYVDIDQLDGISESLAYDLEELLGTLARLTQSNSMLPEEQWQPKKRVVAELAYINPTAANPDEHIQPAQLVYLSPDVPDTLILTELAQ